MTDNELIAQFMGAERREGPRAFNPDQTIVQWIIKGNPYNQHRDDVKHWYQPVELKYHESFDWLMPVVEKIAKIETNDKVYNGEDSYFDSYFPRTFAMINCETREFMVRLNRNPLHQSTSLIEASYKAVVEFIKWYNQQQNDGPSS